jgi:hypothetical protein
VKTLVLVMAAILSSTAASLAQSGADPHLPLPNDIGSVAPALESYAQGDARGQAVEATWPFNA